MPQILPGDRILPDFAAGEDHGAHGQRLQDIDENAVMVNALQRHATVIVQKSLRIGGQPPARRPRPDGTDGAGAHAHVREHYLVCL